MADNENESVILALRLLLTQLQHNGSDVGTLELLGHLLPLHESDDWSTLFGCIGYLLSQQADGLRRGYGGAEGAIDAVTALLASHMLEEQRKA